MNNLFRRLNRLPWLPLIQTAGYTILAVFVLEFLLVLGQRFPIVEQATELLFTAPLSLLISMSIAVGAGAIAVYLLERFQRDIFINTGVLWALVGCMMLMLLVRSLSGIPSLIPLSQPILIGVILGVFWKGKSHWR